MKNKYKIDQSSKVEWVKKIHFKKYKKVGLIAALIITAAGLVLWTNFFAKPVSAVPWASTLSEWGKRKQLTLVNNSGQTLNQNTTYSVNVDTASLFNNNPTNVLMSCDDVRIVYQPDANTAVELPRSITLASGANHCQNSSSTVVNFPLQASLTNGATSANYYLYYANAHSTAYSSVTALQSFNTTPGNASFQASFNGQLTAIASGSGVPTTQTGAIRYSGGKSALSFDGVDQYVNKTNPITTESTYTYEAWFYPRDASNANKQGIIGSTQSSNDKLVYLQSSKIYLFYYPQVTDTVGTTTINSNTWYHVALVRNGSSVKIYVNGVLDQSQTVADSTTVAGVFDIGRGKMGAPYWYFNGLIDEVRVSEVARYTANFSPQTSPLVRDGNTKILYHLDENGDDPRNTGKVIDDSGNGNNGTITGAKYVGGLVGVDSSATDSGIINSQSFASHQGVFIEEGTTNKITNPSFENSTFDTNWQFSDFGTGADGNCTIASGTTTIDTGSCVGRTPADAVNWNITANIATGSSTIALPNVTGLVAGDEILLINLRDPNNVGAGYYAGGDWTNAPVGHYETHYVKSISGTTITLDVATTTQYDGTKYKIMVQRVPQYNAVTVGGTMTISAYNDTNGVGGVLFFRALGTVTITGSIDASGKGYAGGAGTVCRQCASYGGITYNGQGGNFPGGASLGLSGQGGAGGSRIDGSVAGTVGAGGGAGGADDAGGGGAGYGSVGTGGKGSGYHGDNTGGSGSGITGGSTGPYAAPDGSGGGGGGTYGAANLSQLFLGSAGGGGGGLTLGGSGGNGGGIVFIGAPAINISGGITNNGANGGSASGGNGAGGGGAGGSIYLKISSPTIGSALVTASAGSNGTGDISSRNGGAGGVGRIHIDSSNISGTTSPAADTAAISLAVTANTTAPYYKFGSNSAKIVAASTGNYVIPITATTATHTLSAYVYDGTTGNVGGTVGATVAKLVFNGAAQTTTYTDMGGGWWRLTFSDTPSSASLLSLFGVQILSGKTVYVDGVQLEAKAYSTTYADGTLGTGYAWDTPASPNNSTSTRTKSTLQYPVANNISHTSGTFSFWMKPTQTITTLGNYSILTPPSGNTNFNFWLSPSGSYFNFSIGNATCTGGCYVPNTGTYNPGSWYLVTITYDYPTQTVSYYKNGTLIGSKAADGQWSSTWGTTTTIGIGEDRRSNGEGTLDSTISDFRAFDTVLTGPQVSQLYYSGLGSHSEAAAVNRFAGPEDPVAFWKFDEGTGTVANNSAPNTQTGGTATSSANTLNGTLTNMSATAATNSGWIAEDGCVAGKCLGLDGINDYVAVADNPVLNATTALTLSSWVKFNSKTGTRRIIVKNQNGVTNGYYLDSDGTNLNFRFYDSNGTLRTAAYPLTNISLNQWYFVEGTFDGSALRLFVNGIQVVKTDFSGSIGTNSVQLLIGTDGGYANYFSGYLDEVKVYNYARGAAQVKADFDSKASAINKGASAVLGASTNDALNKGLVGYWKMDEASWNGTAGEVKDASGNGNNGTAGNAVVGAGKFGNGGIFDGADDSVSFSMTALSTYTYSMWVKTGTLVDASGYILTTSVNGSNNCQYLMYVSSKIRFKGQAGGSIDSAALSSNTWLQIVAVNDVANNTSRLYIGGVLAGSSTAVTCTQTYDNSYRMGRSVYNPHANDFAGSLDDVRIYNRALSPEEVQQLYNFAPGPAGYWKFDEGQGSSVTDSSGLGNTGTWYGASTQHYSNGKYGKDGNFDGASDYVDLGSNASLNINNNLTITAWIKVPTTAPVTGTGIVTWGEDTAGKRRSLLLWNGGSGHNKVYFSGYGAPANLSGTTTVDDNIWRHVAVTLDSNNFARVYVNGIQENSGSLTLSSYTFSKAYIAATKLTGDVSNEFFNGSVDDVKIYNYVRSPDQIMEDMNGRASPIGGGAVSSNGKGTVGYWAFEEGQGTLAHDLSGNGNTGTLTGMANPATVVSGWSSNGKFGKAVQFDGTDDFVDLGTSSSLMPDSYTVGAWVKIDNSQNQVSLLGWDGTNIYPSLQLDYSNQPLIYKGLNNYRYFSATSPTNLYDLNWHHVVYVVTGNSQTDVNNDLLYIDGKAQAVSTTLATGTPAVKTHTYIARGGTLYKSGVIDEVKIYNYALSPDEVKTEYNHGSALVLGSMSSTVVDPSSISGLKLWLKADAITGLADGAAVSSWTDSSGNSNTATQATGTNQPLYKTSVLNGKPVVRFDGTNDYLVGTTINNINTSSLSIFVVATGNSVSANHEFPFFAINSYNNGVRFERSSWDGVASSYNNNVGLATATNSLPTSGFGGTVVELVKQYGVRSDLWINGSNNVSSTNSTITGTFSNNNYQIGDSNGGDDLTYNGDVAEVLVYNNALSTSDRQKIETYLAQKYGITVATTPTFTGAGNNSNAAQYCVPGDASGCNPPVAEWNFDEGVGGTVNDTSGNNNTGTWNGGGVGNSHWGPGKIGRGGVFNAANDYATLPNNSSLYLQNFTYEAWINPSTVASGTRAVIAVSGYTNGRGVHFSQAGATVNAFSFADGLGANAFNLTTPSILTANKWHHIVLSWDGGTAKIYVNGLFQISGGTSATLTYDNPTVVSKIGADQHDTAGVSRYYNGSIDSVRIFNYARTPAQIAWDYNQGKPAGWWVMDECQGTVLHDAISSTNSATLSLGSGGVTTAGTCSDGTNASFWSKGVSGKNNYSGSFDGTDDAALVTAPMNNVYAVSFWTYPTTTTQSFLQLSPSVSVSASSGVVAGSGFSSPTVYVNGSAGGVVRANAWNHVVVTSATSLSASAIKFGVVGSTYFSGQLDDVKIFTYPLTSMQVKLLNNQGAAVRFGPNSGTP